MHNFGPSRARAFFEALCAFAIGAALLVAAMQTGASALMAAAAVAGLLGLSWSTSLFARTAAPVERQAAEMPVIALAPEPAAPPVAEPDPEPITEPEAALDLPVEPVKPSPPKRRKVTKAKKPKAEAVSAPEPEFIQPAEPEPPHIEQLFESRPFLQQRRPAFGRRSRGPLAAG